MGHKKIERISPLTLNLTCVGVDSHAHVNSEDFDTDREDVLALAHASGVANICNIFVGIEEYTRGRHYFDAHPEVFFALGIHPCDGQQYSPEAARLMQEAFARDERLKAVGEIGLDFFWKDCPKEIQYAALTAQLALARAVERPVIIHCRDAAEECLMLLESQGFAGYPLLWHCFGGDSAMAERILNNGWHISIPGPVTYPANTAVREAVKIIPADRLLLETDSPYLAAMPWRGKTNQPAYTVFTAACVAELRAVPLQELWQQCGDNARRFFGIAPCPTSL
jgi:TatD DNase family protein